MTDNECALSLDCGTELPLNWPQKSVGPYGALQPPTCNPGPASPCVVDGVIAAKRDEIEWRRANAEAKGLFLPGNGNWGVDLSPGFFFPGDQNLRRSWSWD